MLPFDFVQNSQIIQTNSTNDDVKPNDPLVSMESVPNIKQRVAPPPPRNNNIRNSRQTPLPPPKPLSLNEQVALIKNRIGFLSFLLKDDNLSTPWTKQDIISLSSHLQEVTDKCNLILSSKNEVYQALLQQFINLKYQVWNSMPENNLYKE